MRYASICDGIGAAHAAWAPIGWRCVWTSEIEKFPIAVVEARVPGLTNLGDMNNIDEAMLNEHDRPDLVVGGTPCQSFSVAGLRGGLADSRGNLALRFFQLVGEMRPTWVVWENVPGVLSSGGGRDFGSILGALDELGYGYAWSVLDAQWFGVAQRRRRVFVVGHAGDWRRAAAVLLEPESVCGDSPPSRAPREGAAGPARAGAADASGNALRPSVVDRAAFNQGRGAKFRFTIGEVDAMPSLIARGPHAVATWWDGGQTAQTIDAVVMEPYVKAKRAQSSTDDESWKPGEVSPTLNHFDVGDTRSTTVVAFTQNQRDEVRNLGDTAGAINGPGTNQSTYVAHTSDGVVTDPVVAAEGKTWENAGNNGRLRNCVQQEMAVRRLTPTECERLQGFPDGWTQIPWRKKPAEQCPDGPRYRALGNSMAVPVMRWIGERIQKVEEIR